MWSGVTRALVDELRRLGVYAGHRNATPWPRAASLIHRWLAATNRAGDAWNYRREMRALSRLRDAVAPLVTPGNADGWVHLLGGSGEVPRGRYVTLLEMSPSQIVAAGPSWATSFGYPGVSQRQLEWIARRQEEVCRKAYACCVASHWAGDSLVRDNGIDPAKVHVVGFGPNADLSPSPRDWTTPRFLFVGRDWERKNGDAVVRAFSRLRAELPAATLDVVGGHPRLDIDGVTGHGLLTVHEAAGRQRLEDLFARATCFVLPSFLEPFGLVYVEAAHAGLPSIATARGGMIDSVGDGGILIDPTDDEAIFAAMRRLSDPDTARSMGEHASRLAKRLTWPAYAQRVLRSLDLGEIEGVTLAEFL